MTLLTPSRLTADKNLSIVCKRGLDYFISVLLLIPTLPIILGLAIAIKLVSPGPAFFIQKRVGFQGKEINLIKLRTMVVDAEEKLQDYLKKDPKLKDEWEQFYSLERDPRIIPYVGSFIRETSLDELPNLFNVLLGDISLVGPRPLPLYENEVHHSDFQTLRQTVLPGVTGLWQVRRGDTQAMVHWDSHYIQNWSLQMDFQILLETIKVVSLAENSM